MELSDAVQVANRASDLANQDQPTREVLNMLAQAVATLAAALDIRLREMERRLPQ